MSLRYIPDPILRSKTKEMTVKEMQSPAFAKVLEEMRETVAHTIDAIALAAPQIGFAYRVFIISGKIFHPSFHEDILSEELAKLEQTVPDLIFINPVITKTSKTTQILEEGCLSIPGVYGNVKRAQKVSIKAINEHGQVFERGCSGLLSQIVQHEIDHLNGVLFTDKATALVGVKGKEIIPLNTKELVAFVKEYVK